MPALKARQEYSPGQRPGNKVFPGIPSPEGALHTHHNPCVDTCLHPFVVSPLQGFHPIGGLFPGHCPELYYHCPFRAPGSPHKRYAAHSETSPSFCMVPKAGIQLRTANRNTRCANRDSHDRLRYTLHIRKILVPYGTISRAFSITYCSASRDHSPLVFAIMAARSL